jgi:hypothetical protein
MREGETIPRIRQAVAHGDLGEPFTPKDAGEVLGVDFAGVFLPKHRVGNPGNNTELFRQVSNRPALYRLRQQ